MAIKTRILWLTNTPCGAWSHLTGRPTTGGGWLLALSSHLAKRADIDLHIAFYWGTPMPPFTIEGITYHPVLREGDASKWGRYLRRLTTQYSDRADRVETQRLLAVVEAVAPQLIHIHGSEENFGLIARHLPDRPIVLSVQGLLSPYLGKRYAGLPFHDVMHHEPFARRLLMDGVAAERRRCVRAARRERDFMPHIAHVIGRTDWDRYATLALNPERHYHHQDELLREEFYAHQWQPNLEAHRFTIVTTISHGLHKGLETIYRTAHLLTQRQVDFQWAIIGLDKHDPYIRLTSRLTGLSPEDIHVVPLGRKSSGQMVETLCACDLYCQGSHIENSPNAVCEAMLLGMPVVATAVGGTPTMLRDGTEGWLVQEGEPYALAGLLMTLMAQPIETLAPRGECARAKALVRHDPDKVCQQLLTIYQDIRSSFP